MTTPAQSKRKSSYGPRTYVWPPQPPHEFEVISTTSAINAGLAKPFLTNWAAKLVAETAVEDLDIVQRMVDKGDAQGAVAHLKGAPYRKRQAAADRGTLVHAALEAYIAGKKPTEDELKEQFNEAGVPSKLWKSTRLMVDGLIEFMFDEEPDIIWTESTVYSRQHGYAGTADVIARMRVGGSVVPVILDVKTSKAIYDEVALQLASYANADFVGQDDGTELPLIPDRNPIENGIVVRPKPGGGYEKVVFTLTPDVFQMFLGTLAVANGQAEDVLARARRPS
jgi:hypothetical protein